VLAAGTTDASAARIIGGFKSMSGSDGHHASRIRHGSKTRHGLMTIHVGKVRSLRVTGGRSRVCSEFICGGNSATIGGTSW
jgi:hypothetical protein